MNEPFEYIKLQKAGQKKMDEKFKYMFLQISI